jgi:competence protein ComFB
MKLITKDGAAPSDSPENDKGGGESLETSVRQSAGNPPSYKTKLKIEIEPEIEVKAPARSRQPRGQAVFTGSQEPRATVAYPSKDAGEDEPTLDEPEGIAEGAIPDGTPYERLNDDVVQAPRPGMTVYEEVRALRDFNKDALKHDEQRREKKIQIESSLLNRSRSLVNLSEVLTKELLPSVMERMDVCTCPVCTGNVLALALNTLPTKYVTTDEGKQYTQLEVYKRQNELDVMAALTRACVRVKDSPRHEIIDDLDG